MKINRKFYSASILLCAACATLAGTGVVSATVIIDTVSVGNIGNATDTTGFGSVGYEFNIGEYDVTASQYCAFLNAIAASDPLTIYQPTMAGTTDGNPGIIQSGSSGSYTYSVIDGRGNYPATDVNFWNATRFANWLDNRQPTGPEGPGTTETGAYNLGSVTNPDNSSVSRNAGAAWAVTSENEWYKAAYYSPTLNSGAGGYYYYPVQSNSCSISQANTNGSDTTPVGSYPYPSYYGTYDQGGDAYQWNETITDGYDVRGMRGGGFDLGGDYGRLNTSESSYEEPWVSDSAWGFRVSQTSTLASGGLLDLSNKSLIIPNPPAGALANIMSQLQRGYNGGAWNGTSGIISSTAAADPAHLSALGFMINDTGANTGAPTGTPIYISLNGQSTSDGDILVKYTDYGDANLSGTVDGSDYSLIDNGYLHHLTGWYNGDFNYDGIVDGSDYTLIDNAFNTQGASLNSEIASPTTQIAESSPVPEPAMFSMLGFASLMVLSRRKCHALRKR